MVKHWNNDEELAFPGIGSEACVLSGKAVIGLPPITLNGSKNTLIKNLYSESANPLGDRA